MAEVIQSVAYDHPNFTVVRESHMCAVQGPSASLTDFAHFRCRNKCIVTHVTVTCTSLPSAVTTWSLYVMRDGASTIATKTLTSFSAVGGLSAAVITIASSGTLATIGNFFSLQCDTTEKGKFDVVWQYRFLP